MGHSPDQPNLTTPLAPSPVADGSPTPGFTNGSLVAGKYLVEETVAEGGIGVIAVARHLALDQRVAIKYLKPKALRNPSLVERFVREGRLAAQISSDHVVRVYDVGSLPEGGPYMVMEYLVGQDLGSLLRSGPISIPRAVDYVLQACDALAEAHALRIVHRDIKPENLFLAQRASNTPILKIIDFGISKVAPTRGQDGNWAHETAAGERFGTPLYMSPEQLRSSSHVDPRTDIWSLGVTLHELVTGQLPFIGTDLPQLCTSVLASPPIRLTEVLPDASPLLEAILLKCLEKDPDLRFDNVAELAEELVPFGLPGAATRADRIKDVIRRGGDGVRHPPRVPSLAEIRPLAMEAARALASTGEAPAVTAPSSRRATIPPRRKAALAGLGVLACIAGLAIARRDRRPDAARAGASEPRDLAAVAGRAPSESSIVSLGMSAAPSGPPPGSPDTPLPSASAAGATGAPLRASPSSSSKPQVVRPVVPTRKRRDIFGGRE